MLRYGTLEGGGEAVNAGGVTSIKTFKSDYVLELTVRSYGMFKALVLIERASAGETYTQMSSGLCLYSASVSLLGTSFPFAF